MSICILYINLICLWSIFRTLFAVQLKQYGPVKVINVSSIQSPKGSMPCDSYDYENKVYGISPWIDYEIDFVTEVSHSMFSNATETFRRAEQELHRRNASHNELSSVDPKYSGCAWLQIEHIQRAGIGHTFAAWSYYLRAAIESNLTYFATYYTSDHNVCNLDEVSPYFGFHPVFRWARYPPNNATVITVLPNNTLQYDMNDIKRAVNDYLKKTNKSYFSCDDGHVLFYFRNP